MNMIFHQTYKWINKWVRYFIKIINEYHILGHFFCIFSKYGTKISSLSWSVPCAMATILYEICTLCIIVHAWLGSVKLHVAYISSSTTICNLLFVVTPVVCLANFSTVLIQTTNGVESISFITNKNGGQGNVNSLTFYFQFRFFLESFQISLNWPR